MSSARRHIFGKTSRGRAGTVSSSHFVRRAPGRFRRPARRNLVRLGGGGGGARLRRRPTPRARARILVGRFGARGWMSWAAALRWTRPCAVRAGRPRARVGRAHDARRGGHERHRQGLPPRALRRGGGDDPRDPPRGEGLAGGAHARDAAVRAQGADPDEASVAAVRRFARLTGDLGALSEPDLRVVALAYMPSATRTASRTSGRNCRPLSSPSTSTTRRRRSPGGTSSRTRTTGPSSTR